MSIEIKHGDCLEILAKIADNSIDAIVTDPPYGLSFMGKKWDYDVPSVEVWAECLRVLKPGGHLLAFAGTRTQHRMAVRIEDAGFEIRDMIAWVYGSGFPKSLDVSKAIDKCNGEANRLHKFTAWMREQGMTIAIMWRPLLPFAKNEATAKAMAQHYISSGQQPAIPTSAIWRVLRPLCANVPAWVDELVQRIEAEREVVGQGWRMDRKEGAVNYGGGTPDGAYDITAPATPEAQQWAGWGTALKPALEPITMARKPLTGTVAANVLEHGTGALNVDGCRVGTESTLRTNGKTAIWADGGMNSVQGGSAQGRWPANLIHDGSDDVVGLFPVTGASKAAPRGGTNPNPMDWGNGRTDGDIVKGHTDNGGSAARFFYCAKANKADRDEGCEGIAQRLSMRYGEKAQGPLPQQTPSKPVPQRNHHPTVKPTDLMRYLCRLVTPPGGTVLDPFMGSGSTGKAAALEGFKFIGIERDPEYIEIAKARIKAAQKQLNIFS